MVDVRSESVFATHDAATAHMNLATVASTRHAPTEPANVPAWMGEELMSSHPSMRSSWLLVVAGAGRVSFQQGCGTQEQTAAALSGLNRFKTTNGQTKQDT